MASDQAERKLAKLIAESMQCAFTYAKADVHDFWVYMQQRTGKLDHMVYALAIFYHLTEKYEINTSYLVDLLLRKNRNYSGNNEDFLYNFKNCERWWNISPRDGFLTRMSDKYSRYCSLSAGNPDEVGESLLDTATDLAAYCLLYVYYLDEENI